MTYNGVLDYPPGGTSYRQMEQFLNLFWFAVVLVTTLMWCMVSVRQQRGSHHRPLQEAARLACTLLLLFFTISMTDDLNFEVVFIEGGDQRDSIVLTSHDQPSSGATAAWAPCIAILSDRQVLESCRLFHEITSVAVECRSIIEESLPPDRSPPTPSL
jgi:hypothetical protein